jgi:hypothetical protein
MSDSTWRDTARDLRTGKVPLEEFLGALDDETREALARALVGREHRAWAITHVALDPGDLHWLGYLRPNRGSAQSAICTNTRSTWQELRAGGYRAVKVYVRRDQRGIAASARRPSPALPESP